MKKVEVICSVLETVNEHNSCQDSVYLVEVTVRNQLTWNIELTKSTDHASLEEAIANEMRKQVPGLEDFFVRKLDDGRIILTFDALNICPLFHLRLLEVAVWIYASVSMRCLIPDSGQRFEIVPDFEEDIDGEMVPALQVSNGLYIYMANDGFFLGKEVWTPAGQWSPEEQDFVQIMEDTSMHSVVDKVTEIWRQIQDEAFGELRAYLYLDIFGEQSEFDALVDYLARND